LGKIEQGLGRGREKRKEEGDDVLYIGLGKARYGDG
jgi:hypothetical protein